LVSDSQLRKAVTTLFAATAEYIKTLYTVIQLEALTICMIIPRSAGVFHFAM